jgi:hypothetical protein
VIIYSGAQKHGRVIISSPSDDFSCAGSFMANTSLIAAISFWSDVERINAAGFSLVAVRETSTREASATSERNAF